MLRNNVQLLAQQKENLTSHLLAIFLNATKQADLSFTLFPPPELHKNL